MQHSLSLGKSEQPNAVGRPHLQLNCIAADGTQTSGHPSSSTRSGPVLGSRLPPDYLAQQEAQRVQLLERIKQSLAK